MTPLLRALAQGRLCETHRDIVDGRPYYRKTRVCPDGLIDLANRIPLNFDLLPSASWSRWEADLFARIYQKDVVILTDTSILVPELPGRTLHDILRDTPDEFTSLKSTAIRSAVAALSTLHALDVHYPDGTTRPFAHADATVRNVLYDHDSGTASWFDFETVYRPGIPVADCRANDLRVLLLSAAALIPRRHWPDLAAEARRAYGDGSIIDRACTPQVSTFQSLFELAQCRISERQSQGFVAMLSSSTSAQIDRRTTISGT